MFISWFRKAALAASALPLLSLVACNQSPSLTPNTPYPNYTLSVVTVNPATGVAITVSYGDLTGATNGTAAFTRSYANGTTVVLTAPSLAGINPFASWTGCTSVATVTCTVNVTANKTVTATYNNPPNYTLTVNSSNPTSNVPITVSPADNNGATNGSTSFTRSYVTGTSVTLTAPATSGINNFGSWTGCASVTGTVCTVSLTANQTITANYVTPTLGLTVNSTNPGTGVTIAASPADNNSVTSLSTSKTLTYNSGTQVTLTAQATTGGQIFQSWTGCTSVVATLTCKVSLTSALTVTANYYATNAGKTYYVGPTGSDSNSGLSLTAPFLTLQKAANTVGPGDVVYALTGSYTGATPTSTVFSIGTPGTPTAPIAFRAYPGNTPTINFSSFNAIYIGNNTAYVEINGFTVNGNNQNVTFAQASTTDALTNPGNHPELNGNCIIADGRTSTGNHPNHISILNNIVSNCGAGIAFAGSDYITVSGNSIFNCAWYSAYGTSGLSYLSFYNTDAVTGYKNYITGNRIYNNYELIPYYKQGVISDGEGIIIDTFQNSSASGSGITYAAYAGRTLITNNIIYENGGGGIEILNSAHVDVVNNSSYENVHTPANLTTYATVSGRGEFSMLGASDLNAYNNIWYSYPNQNPVVETSCASCTVNYNLYFNGVNSGFTSGANDVYADPQYNNATTQNLAIVDLSLVNGSPGVDTGTSTLAPTVDFNGNARPQGKGYDRGAFER